jgi:hypothetical protein
MSDLTALFAKAVLRNAELRAEMERREKIWLEHLLTARMLESPPVILVPDRGMEWCKLDTGQVISCGEWPKTERAIIESGTVYFRDFLRSLWRRLRRRPKSW